MYHLNKPLKQITEWSEPHEVIESGQGPIKARTWTRNFKEQLDRNDKRITSIQWRRGKIALFANPFIYSPLCHCDDCQRFVPKEIVRTNGRKMGPQLAQR